MMERQDWHKKTSECCGRCSAPSCKSASPGAGGSLSRGVWGEHLPCGPPHFLVSWLQAAPWFSFGETPPFDSLEAGPKMDV